jgi:PGF-pre-PGF domain-containing protein
MLKSCNFFRSSYYRHKQLDERIRKNNRKPWCLTCAKAYAGFTVFLLFLSLCEPAAAESFPPPAPNQHIVDWETFISVSLTTPASYVFINVTEYDAKQIVKNITMEFREPVTHVSFTLNVLGKRPSYVEALDNSTFLQYYAITFLTGVTDKIANVKMDFAIEKDAEQKMDYDEVTLVLYRYNGEKMEECSTEKTGEDEAFLYFKSDTKGSNYVAAIGGVMPSLWWFAVVLIAVMALIALLGIYGRRRFKLANIRKTLRTWYGK